MHKNALGAAKRSLMMDVLPVGGLENRNWRTQRPLCRHMARTHDAIVQIEHFSLPCLLLSQRIRTVKSEQQSGRQVGLRSPRPLPE